MCVERNHLFLLPKCYFKILFLYCKISLDVRATAFLQALHFP